MPKKPRVLVTGGAGFIGSFLCERFLKEGWEVVCMDNYFTGSIQNIQHLRDNPNFELIRHDIVEPFMVETDLIMNFACPASPVHYQSNPIKTVKTNVLGMFNVLGVAKRVGCRVLQASTSEVYGDPKEHPQSESYWGNVNPIGIRSCYDEGKRLAETLCYDYHREHGVDVRLVRIFNTYGPRMAIDDGRVVSNFICQALSGEPLTVYGAGEQTRSFCFVEDLVEGIFRLANLKEAPPTPINLGNDREFTVKQLAEEVLRQTNQPTKIEYKPLPMDDPKVRKPNLTKAKEILKWEPKIALEEGIRRCLPYFESQLKGES